MTRSRQSAKQAGSGFERLIADDLATDVDDRIDRRVKTGAADRGDIANVRTVDGRRIVLECKDYGGRYHVSEWLREAETERINDNAAAGVVVAKRRGTRNPDDQVVFMTLRDFKQLITRQDAS